jgi:hypothetical protein
MTAKRIARSLVFLGVLAGVFATPMVSAESEESGDTEESEQSIDARTVFNRANRLAGRGALTRSVSQYEKLLQNAPDEFPSAYFNFAEVLKAKGNHRRALVLYQAYLMLGDDPGTRSDAERGIKQVKAQVWNEKLATLSVDIEPETESTIELDGTLVANNEGIEEMTLLAGEYSVSANAVDHLPQDKTITLERQGSDSVSFDLDKKTFFGKATVSVSEDGATVKFQPEELDAPDGPDEPVVKESPIEESVELETGKWLLEVTKPDYHRWVRYIRIKRDKDKSVDVQLEEKLPEEIR